VTSVPASFAAENADVLAKFLKVTADMNAMWLTDSEEMLPVIAKDAGMSEADAADTHGGLPVPHRRGSALGQVARRRHARVHQGRGVTSSRSRVNIPTSRDTYDGAVNTGPPLPRPRCKPAE
jgi:taurine transport system substrate-binding protein